MAEVVSITGRKVAEQGEVSEALIANLEMLLERAKTGEIKNAVVAYTDRQGLAAYLTTGIDRGWPLLGALTAVQVFLANEMHGQEVK